MRTMLGQVISYCAFCFAGSMRVLGDDGGGGGPSFDSYGRKVNGTPKMLTYSGSKRPVSRFTSYEVRRSPRPTTCSHNSWLVKARSPIMCVTVLASQPSESIPTDITLCTYWPGISTWPTVSTL